MQEVQLLLRYQSQQEGYSSHHRIGFTARQTEKNQGIRPAFEVNFDELPIGGYAHLHFLSKQIMRSDSYLNEKVS